jgi:hypothetical protein
MRLSDIDQATIERLADAVAARIADAVPLDQQVWTLTRVAKYLGRHVETVRESMACLPSFPRAIHLPGRGEGRGKALYNAGEIIKWAHSYREKH